MVCGIIWADIVAPRGVEAATSYKELAIATTKKTHKESTNIRQLSKDNLMEGLYVIKSKLGEQQS